MNHLIKLLSLSIVLLFLGCGPNYILDKQYEITNNDWMYSDTLDFGVTITDSLKIYNLYIELERNSEWCKVSIPIQQGAYFDMVGDYLFTVEQYMRVDPLPGVKSIAFKIEETADSRS